MDSSEEPLMVQKVLPDGFMLLNGHHRWAAYMRLGVTEKVRIEIINLTKETDIERMLQQAMNTKRVLFVPPETHKTEPELRFPFNKIYKERLRAGTPDLAPHRRRGNRLYNGQAIWI